MQAVRRTLGLVAGTVREIRTLRKLRKGFSARLGLSAHPTLEEVRAAVARSCGTPIRIVHLPLRHPFTGGLLHTPTELTLVVDRNSPTVLQHFVIAHELAHAFLGHDPQTVGHELQSVLLAGLAPALDPRIGRMMLARSYFDGPHPHRSHGGSLPEREAETLGRLIVSMITDTSAGAGEGAPAASALRHRGTSGV
ncbi:ImmA/IrrE family metallo-endopeptidase [Streptomyces sp. NPDC059917]|uniref:ImmA/IrrE family metallo-endopeptidase n=1 Tax=Streptomyces sp. NPDC059917 TaxID=3347002 RepID=UPI00364F7C01